MASNAVYIVVLLLCTVAGTIPAPQLPAGTAQELLAKGRAFQEAMIASMRQPESRARMGDVLPLLRSLTRSQRVGLATMLQTAPLVTALHPERLGENASLASLLPQLDVVSLLRRGAEEEQRQAEEEARSLSEGEQRSLSIDSITASSSDEETIAAAPTASEQVSHNATDEEGELPPEAAELRGYAGRLPPEVMAAILNTRRTPGQYPPLPRLPPGGPFSKTDVRLGIRVPAREQHRVSMDLLPPPMPPRGVTGRDDCELYSNDLCVEVADYPREAILTSMKRSPSTMLAMLASEPDPDTLERRQDGAPIEENLIAGDGGGMCQTSVKFARPKRARNTSGKWKFLVNTGDEHSQTLRVEMCTDPGEACSYVAGGMASHCVQIFSHHRLLAWDKDRGLHMDIFKVPTCCSCHVQPGYGPNLFPSDTSSPKDLPGPVHIDHETDYEETEEDVAPSNSRPITPAPEWERPRSRRPVTMPSFPGKTTRAPATTTTTPSYKEVTYPPVFNKDLRKRNRPRDKVRDNVDLDDSASIPAQRRRRPIAISSDKIRGSVSSSGGVEGAVASSGGGGGGGGGGGLGLGSRINYSYHPIIDFFHNEHKQQQQQQHRTHQQQPLTQSAANRRTSNEDDWKPISPAQLAPHRH